MSEKKKRRRWTASEKLRADVCRYWISCPRKRVIQRSICDVSHAPLSFGTGSIVTMAQTISLNWALGDSRILLRRAPPWRNIDNRMAEADHQ